MKEVINMAEAKKTYTCGYCGKSYDTIEERTACETRCAQAQKEEKAPDPRLGHVAYCSRCGFIFGGGIPLIKALVYADFVKVKCAYWI